MQKFKQKIQSKKAVVAVVGLGYVGLPLAHAIKKAGFEVVGIDIKKIQDKFLRTTTSYEVLKKADIVIICLPTPLTKHKEPDMSYIKAGLEEIKKHLQKNQLIILESTTYPGTTEELLLPALESTGLKVGQDFYLAYSPERIDPGNQKFNLKNTPKVIAGVTKICTNLTKLFYEQFIDQVVPVSSPKVAETAKLLENIFRIVNISMINELALLCGKMDIDIWEVIEAAKTKPFGFMPFYPSAGAGGHCLEKHQKIFIKHNNNYSLAPIYKIYQQFKDTLEHLQVLSYNQKTQKAEFNRITLFARRSADDLMSIRTYYNHQLKITSKHPVFVYTNKALKIKFAQDIKTEDSLIFSASIPQISLKTIKLDVIDIIKTFAPDFIKKIRAKPKNGHFKHFKKYFTANKNKHDYLRYNYLPLKIYLDLEKQIKWPRENLKLATGNGPSYNEISAIINLDKDFCRLIGYYLSEGCLTSDSKTRRIRFTFHTDEQAYINDIKNI